MKTLLFTTLMLISQTSSAGCVLSGLYKVSGDWAFMNEWFLRFDQGELVDSYTDSLESRDWPTTMSVQNGNQLKINSTTYASDAILESTLLLNNTGKCINGRAELILDYAYDVMIDETGSEGDSVQRVKIISIEAI